MHSLSFARVIYTSLALLSFLTAAFAERELHVVGIYEGVDGGTDAQLTVHRPGQSVTLVLTSYDSVNWRVNVGEGTIIERVFVSGYHRQTISGLPPNVPATLTSYDEGTGYFLVGYSVDSTRFLRAVPHVAALTGQEISSFHGGYQPPATGFAINSVQNDPRLRSTYPQPVPASQLPNLTFELATFDGGAPNGELNIRRYGLDGPVDGGPLLKSGPVMNADAALRYYYGGHSGLTEVDSQTGAARVIPVLEEITREGWQTGTAFDRKRNRALLVTLSGEGFLYGYSPAQSQWLLRTSMRNRDFDSITYHDADDSLYAVTQSYEDSQIAKIVKLTADGVYQKDIPLPILPFDINFGKHRSELVSAGEYLVLLLAPDPYPYSSGLRESRIYLIDPRTSEVQLTYRSAYPPNQRPEVSLQPLPTGELVAPGSVVPLRAIAYDRDGTIASVEFFADQQSIGFGTRELSTGIFRLNWTASESGSPVIVAKATDNKGATGVSLPMMLLVDRPPAIVITSPANGSTVELGSNAFVAATAQDPDGTVASVRFTVNGQLIGEGAQVPGSNSFTSTWTPLAPGTFTIGASATDNLGFTVQAATVQIVVKGPASGTVKAMRSLPRFYQSGKRLTVLIIARPSSKSAATYTITDHVPPGWTVNAISSGGRFDPQTGTVTFGPFTDRRPRALLYRVTPPSTASGPQHFTGTVNVDGSETAISGNSLVNHHPRAKRRPTLPPVVRQPYQ